jgi:hypothetical protein
MEFSHSNEIGGPMFILKLLFFVLFFIVGLVLLLMLPGKIYRHFFL